MDKWLVYASIFLSFTIILSMIRGARGKGAMDRLIAINVIGTKTMVLICMIAFIMKETYFIDVVLVYALINFISNIVIAKYIQKSGGNT